MKRLTGILIAASLLVGAAPADAASIIVWARPGDSAASAGKRCAGNVGIDRVAVNGRAIAFAEDGATPRMYGRGAVIELRHHPGGRLRVRVAAVRRVRVVVKYRCVRH